MQSKLSRLQKEIILTLYPHCKKPFELNRRMLSQKVAKKIKKHHSTASFQVSMCNSLKALEKRGLIESINWDKYRSYVQLTEDGISTVKELKARQKKVLLVDIDSKIPNLALMKLSAYHKKMGDKVSLLKYPCTTGNERINHRFDKVYISSIFEDNKEKTVKFSKQFKDVEMGGYFIEHKKELPYQIEHIMPDYSLYKCKYSMGFTTRGCIRNCDWCIVPKKEGKICVNSDIYEFWDRSHKHLDLLDNNPMALPEHFKKIADQIIKENLTVSFHGLDARLLNDENTELLSRLNIKPEPRFAFDTMEAERGVLRAIKLMEKHGIKRALWYVLVGFDTNWEEDMYRVELLKKLGQRPYVMRYKTVKDKNHPLHTKYALFASWANQYQFFHVMDFDKFLEVSDDRSKIN